MFRCSAVSLAARSGPTATLIYSSTPRPLEAKPTITWTQIARMRDHLAHRYFDTNYAIIAHTVDHDLIELAATRSTRRPADGLLANLDQ